MSSGLVRMLSNALELCLFPGAVSQALLSLEPLYLFFPQGSVAKLARFYFASHPDSASQPKCQQGDPASHGSPVALLLCQDAEPNRLAVGPAVLLPVYTAELIFLHPLGHIQTKKRSR